MTLFFTSVLVQALCINQEKIKYIGSFRFFFVVLLIRFEMFEDISQINSQNKDTLKYLCLLLAPNPTVTTQHWQGITAQLQSKLRPGNDKNYRSLHCVNNEYLVAIAKSQKASITRNNSPHRITLKKFRLCVILCENKANPQFVDSIKWN